MNKTAAVILSVLIFVTMLGFQPNTVKAGGIPVIDAANLTEQLRQYLHQLQEFQEMIGQTTMMTEQYLQMVRDYEQVLREYNHFLNQIKGIRQMISDQDWWRMMRLIDSYYGDEIRSAIATMDPEDSTYEEKVDDALGNYGHVPRDPDEVKADAEAIGIWSDQYAGEVNEDYRNYGLYKDRMRMVSDNESKIEELRELIKIHQNNMNNLGDESELATLQENNLQNLTIMKQNDAILKTMNQGLLNMESTAATEAARRAKAREAEIRRLKNRKPTELLGRDNWGYF